MTRDPMSGAAKSIELVDVTLRDGLQLLKRTVPTAAKLELLEALAAAGVRRAEVGSFVNPKLLPQFNDTPEMLAAARRLPGLSACVLVPNRRGFDTALQHRPDEVVIVVSASEAHNRSNINRTVGQSLAELSPMLADGRAAGIHMRLAIATAFHCPFDGAVGHDKVFRVLDEAMASNALAEVVLCDTIGHAFPHEIAALVAAVAQRCDTRVLKIGVHAHDTRGRGVANARAAATAGAPVLDGALAGLGGCPYAPGASGTVAIDAVAAALQADGIATGTLIDRLERAAALAAAFADPEARAAQSAA